MGQCGYITHDSGMSTLSSGTAFANAGNVITQTTSIFGQLTLGARYFDIRPVISGGQFSTGHYGHVDQINSSDAACFLLSWYTDAISTSNIAALAMAVNSKAIFG
ncbi:hypothetical protein [Hyalangium gracile]|uniref:hypothetical protein n=1 Tax=Hyalangium gracile TaxID=394092 RepID=UPI001CCCAA77|nr:hypothetical protein [Hyalangium gracile]